MNTDMYDATDDPVSHSNPGVRSKYDHPPKNRVAPIFSGIVIRLLFAHSIKIMRALEPVRTRFSPY